VEYRGSKKATLSVWRPRIVSNDVGEEELVAMQTVADQVHFIKPPFTYCVLISTRFSVTRMAIRTIPKKQASISNSKTLQLKP
jgi:hypothetical protein